MPGMNEIKKGLFSYEEADKGWVAVIKSAGDLIKAAEKVKDAGVRSFDCFSPFPIHGLDKAMGLNRSWLPFITAVFGFFGAFAGLAYMTYIDVISWPINYGGKPHFAWPAYMVVMFELGVLFASMSTVAAVIVMGRLFKPDRKPPVDNLMADGFALWIGDDIEKQQVESILGSLATEVRPAATGDADNKEQN